MDFLGIIEYILSHDMNEHTSDNYQEKVKDKNELERETEPVEHRDVVYEL